MGLTKRKNGWYVEFPVVDDGEKLILGRGLNGAKLKRWKAGTNKTLATDMESQIRRDLALGLIKSDRVKNQAAMTFKALAEAYLAAPEVNRQVTYPQKDRALEVHLLPVLGDRLLQAITPGMIEEYREQRRKHPGRHKTPVKVATVNRDLALLKHMFSFAMREGWTERNPVRLVKLEKENNARDRVLSAEEFEQLQAESAPHLKAVNQMAYQTAMRSGEILNLTWDRVDLKAGLIRLHAEDTKTNDARLIPLTPDLTALLKDLYKVRYLHEPHVFLIKGKSVRSIKTAFKAACRRAKITGFLFHDFRHTAITNMRRAGIDHLTIMRITGHKTLEVFKRYNSFQESDLKEAASRFNTYLTLAHQSENSDTRKSAINHAARP